MLNGLRIRELRREKGLTTLDLETLSKDSPKFVETISKSYIEELERGDKKNPSFGKIELLADLLGCKIDDLRAV